MAYRGGDGPRRGHGRLRLQGQGTRKQEWSEDSTGTQEPFTVLAPKGQDARSDRAVVVSVTGFEGYEGKLDQAAGYGEGAKHIRVDGHQAIFTPARSGHRADLVVVRGDDLAVRVTAARGTRDDLVAVERQVRPAGDHARAPAVPEPPGDLRVVGSVDAGVQVALYPTVLPDTDEVPGMPSGYGTGWQQGASTPAAGSPPTLVVRAPATPAVATPPQPAQMALVAYPGGTADIPALPGLAHVAGSPSPLRMTPTDVAGRPAMLIERRDSPAWVERTLITHAAWGDLLVLAGSGAVDTVPTADQMRATLASATRATAAQWDGVVAGVHGGPGLHPDAGRVELARGRAPGHDVSWLLQAVPGQGGQGASVDHCLKLSTGRRACAFTGGVGGTGTLIQTGGGPRSGDPDATALGEFVVVAVDRPAAALRVTVGSRHADAPLHPVPGSSLSGTVVFLDGVSDTVPACPGGPDPAKYGLTGMTIQLLDDRGTPAGCVT